MKRPRPSSSYTAFQTTRKRGIASSPILNDAGLRTLCPYVRGYGPTRFLDPATPRSAQYTAIASRHPRLSPTRSVFKQFTLVGHDWGARASYCGRGYVGPGG